MENKKLENEKLLKVSGGFGGPIYSNCAVCGKTFQSGNAGVNHLKYPLKTVCPACAERNKK